MNNQKNYYKKQNNNTWEQGNIVLLTLAVFLILVLIEGALIIGSFLERRISLNDINAKQARLAVDSCLEWLSEDLHRNLTVNGDHISTLGYKNQVVIISDNNKVSFLIDEISMETPLGEYSVFMVKCIGVSGRAKCRLTAKLRFDFDVIDEHSPNGKEYKKGQIIYYELPDSI